ncbi:hypothetical protein KZX50_05845 [Bacillus infantis]|uniref:hypothetical protein n=1 Tax=Bacillus infantis TaxID=324767 RepID=UPI000B9A9A22|nr:hypothetical protein [Bacillus infantis]MCK6204987.1 hypothetical protein [Bacillus infantis]OXT18941.1 hypothetical protein B9K06_00875 [Bacillus sp. OG2]
MESFVFALASLLLLLPIFYFLPLRISGKGKILLIAASFFLSLLAMMASVQFHVWQSLLLVCLLALVTAYLLEKKLPSFFQLGYEGSGDESESEQQEYQPENNEHYIDLGKSPEEDAGSVIEDSFNSETEEYESFQAPADSVTEETTDILDSWELEESHKLELEDSQEVSESGSEYPGEAEEAAELLDDLEFLEKKIDQMEEGNEKQEVFEKNEENLSEDSFSYLSEIEELMDGVHASSAETGSEGNDAELLDRTSEPAEIFSGSHLSEIEELMELEGEDEPSAETGSESNYAEELDKTSEPADVINGSNLTEIEELSLPEDDETEVKAADVSAQEHEDSIATAPVLDGQGTEYEQIDEQLGEIILAEPSSHSEAFIQEQNEWEELEIIEAPFGQNESEMEELPGQSVEAYTHEPIEEDAESGGSAETEPESAGEKEDLLRRKKRKIELQQQMILSVVSQLRLSRHSIGQYEYESILKEQLKPNLVFKHYYSFASLLIEHYIQTKELDKLQELLQDLSSKSGGNPLIKEEINFLVQKYSNQ